MIVMPVTFAQGRLSTMRQVTTSRWNQFGMPIAHSCLQGHNCTTPASEPLQKARPQLRANPDVPLVRATPPASQVPPRCAESRSGPHRTQAAGRCAALKRTRRGAPARHSPSPRVRGGARSAPADSRRAPLARHTPATQTVGSRSPRCRGQRNVTLAIAPHQLLPRPSAPASPSTTPLKLSSAIRVKSHARLDASRCHQH